MLSLANHILSQGGVQKCSPYYCHIVSIGVFHKELIDDFKNNETLPNYYANMMS